jgi:hypothetical protein
MRDVQRVVSHPAGDDADGGRKIRLTKLAYEDIGHREDITPGSVMPAPQSNLV